MSYKQLAADQEDDMEQDRLISDHEDEADVPIENDEASFNVPLHQFKDTIDADDEVAEPADLSFGDIDEEMEKLTQKSFSVKSKAQILGDDDHQEQEQELVGAISFGKVGAVQSEHPMMK